LIGRLHPLRQRFGFMERMPRENLQALSPSSMEHTHRYLCAKVLARGSVLDLACGIGYGAKILLDNPAVTDYVGVDVAEDAIAEAQRTAPAHARFITGSTLDLPFDHAAFDAIVSLETLEHVEDPARAVAEFRRVLKPHGVLVGSVPPASFEDFCTGQYGKNQYHLQKFCAPEPKQLLTQRMLPCRRTWHIEWVCCWSVASISRPRAWSWTAVLPPAWRRASMPT